MATIYIDNSPYEVADGQNLLKACLGLGFNIPYFCWHPAMGSVGACRLCAVKQFKDENDRTGRIVMSCMTPASNGIRISIDDPEVRDFRHHVIEWLMLNHPHDCPVCDEGGECHLQDMTMMTGHAYRRTRFKKRTYRNQYLGPFLNHEMNRCIQCYRCVRFYRDLAGGHDLDVFGAHDMVYFGRQDDGVLESEFAGNLAEVCPTGVFTDKTLGRHYTRKWDLQNSPSICHHCGVGCNLIASERYGSLRRVQSRYNDAVNGYFICDRGRFGYEHVNSDLRIRFPLVNNQQAKAEQAIQAAQELLKGGRKVAGIGSPRASLEANFALRQLVGAQNFCAGIPQAELDLQREAIRLLSQGPVRTPSLREIEQCDAVLILGEDVTNSSPMIDLAMRQAVRRQPMAYAAKLKIPEWDDASVRYATQGMRGPLHLSTPAVTKLDEIAATVHRAAPSDIARLGYAIAEAIASGQASQGDDAIQKIAQDLLAAKNPVIISGPSLGSFDVLHAAAAVVWALHEKGVQANLCFTAPECNSTGLAMMTERGLESAIGQADVLVVLENDLSRRVPPKSFEQLTQSRTALIVIDHYMHPTAEHAAIVLPAGAFAESDGTLVNNEGRAQRFYQTYVPEGVIQESWRWIRDIALPQAENGWEEWHSLDAITAQVAHEMPQFAAITNIAPPEDYRIEGLKIARESHRYSGRTAMLANVTVHEPKPPQDPDSPLAFSMEGYQGVSPAPVVPFFWRPGWNSQQSINKYQIEIGGPLHGGPAGRRLIEPAAQLTRSDLRATPKEFSAKPDALLLLPMARIFGSEELSRHAPAIAELIPPLALYVNARDAEQLHLQPGKQARIEIADYTLNVIVELLPHLPQGLAGIPAGYPETAGLPLPALAKVSGGGGA